MPKFNQTFNIRPLNFEKAGEISSFLKKHLLNYHVNKNLIKQICIAAYEAEINVVIHSYGGYCNIEINDDILSINFIDSGPGIENIQWAMEKGNSTASQYARDNGFGAGMGLPNMKMNCDDFHIESNKNGTNIQLKYKLEFTC